MSLDRSLYTRTDKQLLTLIRKHEPKAQAFKDKHGMFGYNHSQSIINEARWELARRKL